MNDGGKNDGKTAGRVVTITRNGGATWQDWCATSFRSNLVCCQYSPEMLSLWLSYSSVPARLQSSVALQFVFYPFLRFELVSTMHAVLGSLVSYYTAFL